ncbi:Uncharacterised protein [Mycobacteroides abscessus subsp. abscessus]|nr:Uncharacterised protein [Mycobacteroides abscessus subsp. abscessus]
MPSGEVTSFSTARSSGRPVAFSTTAPSTSSANEYRQALPGANCRGAKARRLRFSRRSKSTTSMPSDMPRAWNGESGSSSNP